MSATTEFVDDFSKVATFPSVVAQLTQLINDQNSTMKQFEDIIQMDPILVVRVLKLVNSSAFSLMQKVDSISRAIAFLGMRNLHNLAVTDTLHGMFGEDSEEHDNFSRKHLWLHSAATALTSKLVAERIFGERGDEVYLSAILHNIGIIIEAQVRPEEFLRICKACKGEMFLVDLEQQTFQTNHSKIGYLITKQWNMPLAVSEAILAHHNHTEEVAPSSLAGIIQISEYLIGHLNYTVLPNTPTIIAPNLMAHIQENADEYEVFLEDLPEELEALESMYP